jgi:hypothetical protein
MSPLYEYRLSHCGLSSNAIVPINVVGEEGCRRAQVGLIGDKRLTRGEFLLSWDVTHRIMAGY